MKCKTEGCYHTMTRRGRMNRKINSWSIGMCPCCLMILIELDIIKWKGTIPNHGCSQYLGDKK